VTANIRIMAQITYNSGKDVICFNLEMWHLLLSTNQHTYQHKPTTHTRVVNYTPNQFQQVLASLSHHQEVSCDGRHPNLTHSNVWTGTKFTK
jgi:hypothetical protein